MSFCVHLRVFTAAVRAGVSLRGKPKHGGGGHTRQKGGVLQKAKAVVTQGKKAVSSARQCGRVGRAAGLSRGSSGRMSRTAVAAARRL